MNKWLNKLKVKAILPAAALMAAAAIGTTFAWQQWDLSVENQMKAHDTAVSVNETFEENNKELKQNVYFKNEGSSSVFLRVAFSEYWEKDGKILSNTVNGESVAKKEWAPDWTNSEDWTHCRDGWSYYKISLKPDESTDPILISAEANSDDLPEEYVGANYHLYFKAEVVQCSDGINTLNSDAVNVAAINEVFKTSITTAAFSKTEVELDNGETAEVYQVTWPGNVPWEEFKKGGQNE